jgi:flavin-dependent thymidylate synthase
MHNTVTFIGSYGGDFTHAQSAWCSTNNEMTPDRIERIPKLLEMLVKGSDGKSHETPFEKSFLHFHVRTDIATHIHLLKHRIAVPINAESARYKELMNDTAYIPLDWPVEWYERLDHHAEQSFALYHDCLKSLVDTYGFDKKRAKESARFFNLYATQLTADIGFNFRSFVHFCQLRGKTAAQKEVKEVCHEMIRKVMTIDNDPFHYSIQVWGLDKMLPENK